MVKILPSILAANFGKLDQEIIAVEAAGADLHHIDVMDGNFVPNISFGEVVIDALQKQATIPLDIHLMINDPEKYLKNFLAYKPAYLTIHAEIPAEIEPLLLQIRAADCKVGLAIKPKTSFTEIKEFLHLIDMLVIMTVEPGFGGQKFIAEMVEKIAEAKEYCTRNNLAVEIEVDGGINTETAMIASAAGATLLVAGSTIYNQSDTYEKNIKNIRNACSI
ncbi:D-ribulose-5-phosphate 3-epimerase [Erysipelotrichaceae bacterium]|nr:D-ribulose-5-phosphate 3-epimerase [Erysipelotrichaceae bacterium]